jgi:hypothetical protein
MKRRRLVPCPSCQRHVLIASTDCPFCGVAFGALASGRLARRALGAAVGAMSVGAFLAACGPSQTNNPPQTPPQDPPQTPPPDPVEEPAPEPQPEPVPSVEPSAEPQPEPVPETDDDDDDRPRPKYGMPPPPRPAMKYGMPPKN